MSKPSLDADLAGHLERWVAEGLLSRAEADAILRFETRGEAALHRIPLATEAIGYVGAALLLAAGATLVSRVWDDTDAVARVTVLTATTALLIGLGWALRRSREPAIDRLSGVLWVLGTLTTAGLVAVIAVDVADASGRVPGVASALGATVVAIPLYLMRRKALQHLALFFAAYLAVVALSVEARWQGLAMWALAAVWTGAGWRRRLPPRRAAYAAGSFAMLMGSMNLADQTDAGLWLGLATAVVLLVASVIGRERVLLGFGAAGLFVFLLRTIQAYLGGGGMVAGLAIAGIVVLVTAIFLARRTARSQVGGPAGPRPAV